MKNVFLDQVRKQETRFEDRALYDAMSDGFLIIAADSFEIEYSNRSFEDFESEAERKKVIDLLLQLVRGEISEEKLAQLTDYTKISLKSVNLSDGTAAWLVVLVKNNTMPFRGHYSILNEAEGRIGMGTWQYLIREDKLSFSKGMAQLFGVAEGEHFANNFGEYLAYVNEDDRHRIAESLNYVIATGKQVEDLEHHVTDKYGNEKLLSISTLKILISKDGVYGAQGIIRDITEIKKQELAVAENIRKLNASNEALSEFAYTASHDLQEPLRKIEAFGDRLKSSLSEEMTEKSERYLEKMLSASDRMSHLIDDILKLSRLSSVSIEPEQVSLQEIFKGILSDYEETIDRTGASIAYNLPDVAGSPAQFHQLFQNLLGNALKFMKENRKPVVEVNFRKASKEEVKSQGLNTKVSYYLIAFKDNGIGFEQKFESKVFAPFKRLYGRSEFPGTGIGLAIARKVAENHGGLIRAESTEDVGTTFYIYLPIP